MTSFFSAEGGTIWIKFCRLVQNDMSTLVILPKSKPEVDFQYGRRLSEFNGMLSQSHMPHCRVLAPSEFSVMIPELMPHCRVLLPGKFNDMSFQSHVSRCRVGLLATWWIHCYDDRATCHIAGCCHWANSLSWFQSYIAGCCYLANSMTCHPRDTFHVAG